MFSYILLAINFTNYSALAGEVIKELGLTYTQSGLVVSIAAISYAAVQIPSGMASDKYGGAVVLAASQLLMIAAGLGFALAPSYEVVLITRVFMGLGAGAVIVSCVKLLSANFPSERLDWASGIFISGWGLGFIFILIVLPQVIIISGWRSGLYLTAILTVILLALMPLFLRGSNSGVVDAREKVETSKSKIFSRNLVGCILANFTVASVIMGTMTWAALFLQDKYHITLVIAGLSAAVLGVTTFVGGLMSGVSSIKIGKKKVMMISMVGCVITPILLFPSRILYMDIAIIALIGWSSVFQFGPAAAIVSNSVEKSKVGFAFGIYNSIGFCGSFFSPIILGHVMDTTHSYDLGFVIMGLSALIGVAGVLMLKDAG